MNNPIKYTFLLPAYKASFLEETLYSIQNQTFCNFQVIVSDDCSLENIFQVYENFIDDERFVYRRNEVNLGKKDLISHWNLLVDMCDTEYFIMASDDDVYHPHFLEEIDKLVKERGGFVSFPSAWFSDYATCFVMSENGCCITKDILFSFRMSEKNITGQWGDPDDSSKKIEASLLFFNWMNNFMSRFSSCSSEYERQLVLRINQGYKERIRQHIQNHIYHCRPSQFFHFMKYFPNGLGLQRNRILIHWIRCKLL